MNKEAVIQMCQAYGIHPRQSLGQNFLCNSSVAKSIVSLCLGTRNTSVLEIGPGIGAITEILCDRFDRVTVVEIDQRLTPVLEDRFAYCSHFKLIRGDYLKCARNLLLDSNEVPDAVVSNLPYYVTTPIVLKTMTDFPDASKIIFMIEEDASSRFFARPQSKAYGPLSVMTSVFGHKKKSMTVDSKSFYPAPKTRSNVIVLERKDTAECISEDFLLFVQLCFSNRRKTLLNNLRARYREWTPSFLEDELSSIQLSVSIRADMMEPEDFCLLYSRLFSSNGTMKKQKLWGE